MTDHLEQAAAKAVELAERFAKVAKTTLEIEAAQHLTYVAGLIRGGAAGRIEALPGRCNATAAGLFGAKFVCHLNAGHVGEHMHTDGARWGEVTSGGVLGEVAERIETKLRLLQERDRARAQRDELVRAARDFLSCQNLDNRARLREVVERIEKG